MKFHQLGLIEADETREMSHQLVTELFERTVPQEFAMAIEAYWSIWQKLDEEIGKLEQALKEQAKEDANESVDWSVPGVGPPSSRILFNELGDLSQFENERQLFSYTGVSIRVVKLFEEDILANKEIVA